MDTAREISELLEQIRLGEDSLYEFKQVEFEGDRVTAPNGDSLCQEIAAFANAIGGWLILGVDDKNREILGVPIDRLDLLAQWVDNQTSRLVPVPNVTHRRIELPSSKGDMRPVLIVQVPKSLFVHQAPGGYFRRQGTSKRLIPPNELLRLMLSRQLSGTLGFDETPVVGCGIDTLQVLLYARFFGNQDEPSMVRLRKLKLVASDDRGEEWASVAGCLMATARPADYIPNTFVQCVRYLDTERNAEHQHDAVDIHGPLDLQINGATEFVLRNMHVGARKYLGRIDVPQFDAQAVFEGIANAVAHRDYSIAGAPVQVHQFADRLEITSPGALANSQTLDSIALRTATRNELLTNLLMRCRVTVASVPRRSVMEKRGEGIPLLNQRSLALSGREPVYALLGESALRLTIHAADRLTSPLVDDMPPGFGPDDP